jgi:catechol 2,3-dioxygenase-like lactoylglutathione lyase family enzyme
MTKTNTIRLASVRIITTDVQRTVDFYELLIGVEPNYLTHDFAELVTPTATLAVSHVGRVPFLSDGSLSEAVSNGSIVEFWVDDAEDLFSRLQATYGQDLDVVQTPTMMPWGNVSVVIRDPNGILINLYTPVTDSARQLQRNRAPSM